MGNGNDAEQRRGGPGTDLTEGPKESQNGNCQRGRTRNRVKSVVKMEGDRHLQIRRDSGQKTGEKSLGLASWSSLCELIMCLVLELSFQGLSLRTHPVR